MHCKLVQGDGVSGTPYVIKYGDTTVGRDGGNDIQINHATVSRNHGVLHNLPNVCEIEDLDSRNGTFVNGVRTKRVLLRDGDEVRFGEVRLTFHVIDHTAVSMDGNAHDRSERESENTVVVQVDPSERMPKVEPSRPPVRPLQPLQPLQPRR